jgi:hypothetical protein
MATHHDCLALVLDDVARPANLVAAAQGQEHQLIGRVDGLLGHGCCHGRGLPLGSHRVCDANVSRSRRVTMFICAGLARVQEIELSNSGALVNCRSGDRASLFHATSCRQKQRAAIVIFRMNRRNRNAAVGGSEIHNGDGKVGFPIQRPYSASELTRTIGWKGARCGRFQVESRSKRPAAATLRLFLLTCSTAHAWGEC